ncbi:hypothetical protein JW949_02890 [Candidatus Woesearchaeota archaeon]|nr:hypothetical protein [Candidatus Woesearchaeota archaeon]
MTDLIACLSTGKGTWGHVSRLVNSGEFKNIYLITNDFGKENFNNENGCIMVVVDSKTNSIEEMSEKIKEELKDKIEGNQVAVNLISGTGKEHMAVISAVLKLGLGIRQVVYDFENQKVDELKVTD